MRSVQVTVALISLCVAVAAAIGPGHTSTTKKQDSKTSLHDAKKEALLQDNFKKDVTLKSDSTVVPSGLLDPEVLTTLQQLAANHQLNTQNRTFTVGGITITTGLANLITTLLNGAGPNLGGANNILAATFAMAAAIGAGLAALIAFIVPPLQIINQILAVIALAMLAAYLAEDKGLASYMSDSGYDDTGYSGYGYTGSYDTGNYADDSHSSYSDYRRSGGPPFDGISDLYTPNNFLDGSVSLAAAIAGAPAAGTNYGFPSPGLTGRSQVATPIVNRVANMVVKAVKTYSHLYGEK